MLGTHSGVSFFSVALNVQCVHERQKQKSADWLVITNANLSRKYYAFHSLEYNGLHEETYKAHFKCCSTVEEWYKPYCDV